MIKSKSLMALTIAAMLTVSAQGYAQTQPDPHHPAQGAGITESVPADQQQPSMMMPKMGEMMQMMGQMMQMMGGGQMDMGGRSIPQMGMADHFAGRIAFLRAELNISKAQEKAWDAFAGALHGSSERLRDAGAPAMPGMANADLPSQLEVREKILSAQLEGLRGINATLVPLYAALSEDQRKVANDLLAGPMGFMPGGMTQGGMAQGSMMPMQK